MHQKQNDINFLEQRRIVLFKEHFENFKKKVTNHEFDNLVSKLSIEEVAMRRNFDAYTLVEFNDPFFQYWYDVLYHYNQKSVRK